MSVFDELLNSQNANVLKQLAGTFRRLGRRRATSACVDPEVRRATAACTMSLPGRCIERRVSGRGYGSGFMDWGSCPRQAHCRCLWRIPARVFVRSARSPSSLLPV
jgi:hypothetical protein